MPDFPCARHRRHAMVSSALFAFLEGARRIGRVLRVGAALGTAPIVAKARVRERGVISMYLRGNRVEAASVFTVYNATMLWTGVLRAGLGVAYVSRADVVIVIAP